MGQPSGRILNLPAKYRTYLRCSPVICAADTLSILVHLILYLTSLPLKDAVQLLMHERFGDVEDELEGIQAIEKLTFIRWLFFIFGTLGPAIKLMAMEGVPWTKAWGAMFLASFLVVEVLVVLSWTYKSYDPLLQSQPTNELLEIRKKLRTFDGLLLYFSAFLYAVILFSTTFAIYNGFDISPLAGSAEILSNLDLIYQIMAGIYEIYCAVVVMIFMMTFILVMWPFGLSITDFVWSVTRRKFVVVADFTISYLVLALGPVLVIIILPELKPVILRSLSTWLFWIVVAYPGAFVWRFLKKRAESWPTFSRSVFITWESEEERRGNEASLECQEPLSTFLCFIMFLYTMVLSVIWYYYRYNSEETVNRGWTGVFG